MPRANQADYDKVIKRIEEHSIFRFSAGTDTSGAFLLPTDGEGHPVGDIFYQTWGQLQKLAEILEQKPLSMKGRMSK